MVDRMTCPECQAHLALPRLAAQQTVQCPRCQRVFAPLRPEPTRPSPPLEDEPEYFEPEPERLLPPGRITGEWKSAFVCVMLALCTLLSGIQAWVLHEQIELDQLNQDLFGEAFHLKGRRFLRIALPVDPRLKGLQERRDHHRTVRNIVDPLQMLCGFVTLIIFTIWIVQACRNLRLLRVAGLRFTPFSAAISLYIPIANLFQPYQSVMEIWRASEPNAVRSPTSWQASPYVWPIRAWWFLLIASCVLAIPNVLLLEAHAYNCLRGTSFLFRVGALLLSIYIVRAIATRQRERYDRLYYDRE